MNKKGQPQNIGGLIIWACGILIAVIFTGFILQTMNNALHPQPNCDYSQYENNISILQEQLRYYENLTTNLTNELKERPIVNNTFQNVTYITKYVPIAETEKIYSYIFIGFSTILVLFFSFKFHLFKIDHLFKIEIKELPEQWKKELERLSGEIGSIVKSIKIAKWIIGIFTLLLVIKLIILIMAT